MKAPLKNIPAIQLYPILWAESGLEDKPSSVQDYIAGINLKRAQSRSHLLSSMSSFNPSIPEYILTPAATEVARALWQQGLIRYIKTQGIEGRESMLAACQRLHALDNDHIIRMIGYCLTRLLMLPDHTEQFNALLSCMMTFEQVLAQAPQAISKVPAENLLRDVLFYIDQLSPDHPCIETAFQLSKAWDESLPLQGLQQRVGYYAHRIMRMLAAPDSETTINKERILPDLLPVLDGVLFLQNLPLRAQLEARYKKCPNPLLLIAVPAQKLMAECMRLAVYDKSPN